MKFSIRALIYRPFRDDPEEHRIPTMEPEPDYAKDLKQWVRGVLHAQRPNADEEHVTVLYEGQRRDMFVDEFGALLRVPPNEVATEIYWNASKARGETPNDEWPRIYGVAILFPDHQVWK